MDKDKLIKAGVDYDDGVKRFANRAELYEKYLGKFFDEDRMVELTKHVESGDFEAAFRTAHDLKGMSGNLSMKKFYTKLCELVEMLRGGHPAQGYMDLLNEVKELYNMAEQAAGKR